MKARIIFAALILATIWAVPVVAAEHGGKEHGGAKISEPSADQIRAVMSGYVKEKSEKTGTFDIYDKEAGNARKLSLIRVHERVGKTGNYYYSCADFKDTQ